MATKSPGVYFKEIDNTQYESDDIKSISGTTLAVIGYATKGPTDFPVEINSWKDYVNVFGGPVKGKYSGLMIKNFLAAGGRILFKRVVDKENAAHSNYVIKNGLPQKEGTTLFNREGDFLKSETEAGKLYECTIQEKPFYVRAPKDGRRMTIASVADQLSKGLKPTKAIYEAELKPTIESGFYGFAVKKAEEEPTKFSFVEINEKTPVETIINNIGIASKYYNSVTSFKVSKNFDKSFVDKTYALDGKKTFIVNSKTKIEINFSTSDNDIYKIAKKIQEAIKTLNIKVIGVQNQEALDELIFISNSNSKFSIEINTANEDNPLFLNGEEIENKGIKKGTGIEENSLYITEEINSISGGDNLDSPTIEMEENSNHLVMTDVGSNTNIEIVGYKHSPLNNIFNKTLKIAKNDQSLEKDIEIFKDLTLNQVVIKKKYNSESYTTAPLVGTGKVSAVGNIPVGDLVEIMKRTTSEEGYAAVDPSEKDYVVFYSKELGSGTNTLAVEVITSVNPVNKEDVMRSIIVYNKDNIIERYDGITLDPSDDENYFVNVINASIDDGGSSYIGVTVKKNNLGDVTLPDGFWRIGQANDPEDIALAPDVKEEEYELYNYMVGEDGIPQEDIDGSDGSYLFEEALDPINSPLANKELYDFHIIQTPDNINSVVQDACIKMCESRGDAITIVDPPESLSRDEVIAWHNGGGDRGSLDSNYAAVYWPWCKVYDTTSGKGKYSWVMPSVVMAAQYAKVDKSVGPQMAPAGEKNGLLPVIDIENYPNPNDRDALYTNLNRINPISKFRDGSVVAYGEKTTQRKETVLTKIHTRRMLIQIKKQCREALRGYIFMPNTTDYLGKISNAMVAILEPYKANGGLNSYKVICDETNNPVESRQQDIINVDVALVPQGTIEQININLTLDKAAETVKD